MKFAKELEQDLVPEWRAKYLDYKAGKKRVKAVARAVARANATPRPSRQNPRDNYRSSGSPYLTKKQSPLATHRPPASNAVDSLRDEHGAESRPSTDESTQPILMNKRKAKSPESPRMQYGSFVPTPPSGFNADQLELPGPALNSVSEYIAPERIKKTGTRRTRPEDVDSATSAGRPNTYHAYTVGERIPTTQRPAIRNLFNVGSPTIRHASTANASRPGEPVPLLKRLLSHTGSMRDEPGADVNMVPLDHVRTRETDFFKWMDGQLEKVEAFYKQKEDEAGERLDVLREQLHEMRNRRIEEIANVRKSRQIGRDEALSVLRSISAFPSRQPSLEMSSGSRPMYNDHNTWPRPVEKALRNLKIGHGPGVDPKDLPDMLSLPNLRSEEGMRKVHGMDPARDYVRKAHEQDVPYRSAKRKLKLALKEYYLGLELLKSYALLNRTAFRKINKKYDKAANAHPPLRYMTEKVNKAWFVHSDVLDSHIHAVEDLYARYFERGNHKVAMGKLRSSNGKQRNYSSSAFRSGLLIGTGAVFGIQGLINASAILHAHPDDIMRIYTGYLLQIYGGYLLALYLFSFFCINCSVWAANKINYVFIFEFDPRNHLDWRQLSEFPAFLTLVLGLFVWLNFSQLGSPAMYLYYPVILIFVTVVFIFLPAPVLFQRSRSWFAYSHWRLLLAGLYPVEFRDFFLGDMYCSLTYVTANIELFFCLYAHHWLDPPQCNSSHSRLLGFFTALPGVWRALQCLRRYYDTRAVFPHLANCGKYTTTILYYVSLSMYRIRESHAHLALFITFAAINSIYSTLWDLFMDWSLLQPSAEHKFLRPVLSYKSAWYYYAAMVFDVVLRFNWIFYAIFTHNTQHSTIASFFIAFSEANRRGVWTLFRVENEHAANVMRFKASRDVPLPYKLRESSQASVAGSLTRPADDAEEQEEESQRHSGSLHTAQSPALSRRRSRTSASAREEEQMPSTIRRRMTLTRIMAEAHTQDFEKKRSKANVAKHEEEAADGIEREESCPGRESSEDDVGDGGDGNNGDDENDGNYGDEGSRSGEEEQRPAERIARRGGEEEESLSEAREVREARQAERNAGKEVLEGER